MNALEVKNLTKIYPSFTLDGVSFSVGEGRVVGLIGRNGAGKSTTLKGIFNLIATQGEVNVFGIPFLSDERRAKSLIGYVGGGFRFYPLKQLKTVKEATAHFYPDWNEARYRRFMQLFSLDERKKVSELSEGMKVKFSVTLALSHGAKLLVMDEPTSGLDPLSREEFCDTVLALVKKEGVSVLFSTHITSDLERIADDVVYISNGKILRDQPLGELMNSYRLIRFESREEAERFPHRVIGLKEVKNGLEGMVEDRGVSEFERLERPSLDAVMIYLEGEECRHG